MKDPTPPFTCSPVEKKDRFSNRDSDDLDQVLLVSNNEEVSGYIDTGRRERRVEVGRFVKINLIHLVCVYQCFPTWLLLFDLLTCSSLTICGVNNQDAFEKRSAEHLGCSVECIRTMLHLVGLNKIRFQISDEFYSTSETVLCLLNGSLNYIQEYIKRGVVSIPFLFIVDGHSNMRLRSGKPSGVTDLPQIQWLRDKTPP